MLKSNEKQSHSPKMDILIQYSLTKRLTQGLWGCLFFFIIFIFIYSILLAKCYAFAQIIVVILVWEIFFFFIVMILFFFYLIIRWDIGIVSESKLEVLKDGWFENHNCFYYFLLFCLIILFYCYSNIPYKRMEFCFKYICG
jgi:hypothetical protein